ncbi:hypothetical protein DK52_460 [Brucella abortus]|nr:hypothetical protein DK52_460 [Brucella abortus]
MAKLTSFGDEARIALDTLTDRATGLLSPSLRLGVTGLSRAGKTVFISALVHNLVHGGRLPMFEAYKAGRISRALLEPQPDDAVPRFQYEEHLSALIDERIWPDSTRAISQLRLTIEYETAPPGGAGSRRGVFRSILSIIPANGCLIFPCLEKPMHNSARIPLHSPTSRRTGTLRLHGWPRRRRLPLPKRPMN